MTHWSVLSFWPHFMTFFCGWHMTVSPGSLLFHRLQTFETFPDNLEPEFAIGTGQLASLPYIRSLFYALSMPCFALLFYCLAACLHAGKPDLFLLIISTVPTIATCFKISFSRRAFSILAAFFGLVSFIASHLIVELDMIPSIPHEFWIRKALVYFLIFVQYTAGATSVTSGALNYYRYSHPRAAMLDFEGCYPILRRIFSRFASFIIQVWHHVDICVVVSFLAASIWAPRFAEVILIGGVALSIAVTIPATKYILQMRMIDLLLPCFSKGQTEKKEVRKYIRPIGSIAFAMMALPAAQALLLVGMLFCHTFPAENAMFYSRLLRAMLVAGAVLSSFSRLVSLAFMVFPVESQKLGKKL
jgi:hypothetical protein